jgi:hypothetical protein
LEKIIDLSTGKSLGIDVPAALQAGVDKVVEYWSPDVASRKCHRARVRNAPLSGNQLNPPAGHCLTR